MNVSMFTNTQISPSHSLSCTHTHAITYTVHNNPSQPWVFAREHKSLFDHLACFEKEHKITQKARRGRLRNGLERLIYSGSTCLRSLYISSKPFHFSYRAPLSALGLIWEKYSVSISNVKWCFRWDAVEFNFKHFQEWCLELAIHALKRHCESP